MNFAEVVSAVLDITKRPDKLAETERAVNSALSFFCLKGKFDQDIIESTLSIDPTLYGDTISLSTLTRFRSFQYVKVTGVLGYLNKIDADKIFTPGNTMQKNCYYVAGTDFTYILNSLAPTLEIAYYTYPAVLSSTDTHWLMDMNPFCVIDKAAATIFKGIGDDASMRAHESLARDSYDVLVRDLA